MPKWRAFTWVILVINLLFLIWVIAGIAGSGGTPEDCGTLTAEECNAAEGIGTAIGVGIVFVFWAFVDVTLGVLWLVTRPRGRRSCPACGTAVKAGITVCPKCGHDFAAAAGGQASPPPPPPPPIG